MTAVSPPTERPHEASSSAPNLSVMVGALGAVLFANVVQIAAGLAEIDPSPPADVLPLIAATASLGVAALPMIRAGQRAGLMLGIAFCVMSMIGTGPHKLFLEDGAVIAPMAIAGFIFEVVFIRAALTELRRRR